MKHDDEQIDKMQQTYFDDPNQLENANGNAPLPSKLFPLSNIPLYHAYYHQHMSNVSELLQEPVRNRSTIRKRASDEKLQNITMVLESLLK